MRNDPCKQCGLTDKYIKGNFAYCRPCHSAAQLRYTARKKTGEELEKQKPKKPFKLSDSLSTKGRKLKSHCAHGHPYNKENTRLIFLKNNNVLRKCRACDRNYRRRIYDLKPEPLPARLTDML